MQSDVRCKGRWDVCLSSIAEQTQDVLCAHTMRKRCCGPRPTAADVCEDASVIQLHLMLKGSGLPCRPLPLFAAQLVALGAAGGRLSEGPLDQRHGCFAPIMRLSHRALQLVSEEMGTSAGYIEV